MYANCRYDDLMRAIYKVNELYNDNIQWNQEPVPRGNKLMFTLRTKDSNKEGGRRTWSGRRVMSACWHVHGDFFDILFKECPNVVIEAGGKKITKEHGNWEDIQMGSMMAPCMMSEMCKCYG